MGNKFLLQNDMGNKFLLQNDKKSFLSDSESPQQKYPRMDIMRVISSQTD
jgi:hypothetical protein